MKFTCEKENFNYALNIVSRGVSSRTTLPILKGVKVRCVEGENKVSFFSSDLDICIVTSAPAMVEVGGEVVVAAKLFFDIVREMPSGQIVFELDEEGKAVISGGNSQFDIQGIPSEQFPVMESGVEGKSFSVGRKMLGDMIRRTAFAASLEEARGIITGVLCEISADDISMIALDGFRMAVTKESAESETEGSMVISSRIVNEIGKVLADAGDDEKGDVKIVAGENKAMFVIGETTLIARLMEGEFIKYKEILPKESKISVKVDREELAESVKRSSIIVREGKNAFIKFKVEDNKLIVSSRADEGKNRDVIGIEKTGDDIEIGFNGRFVNDVLRVISDESIVIELSTSISPCIIRPEEGEKYKYLILPVRLSTVNI
jgi:DNA polymerase-3 subunit beta